MCDNCKNFEPKTESSEAFKGHRLDLSGTFHSLKKVYPAPPLEHKDFVLEMKIPSAATHGEKPPEVIRYDPFGHYRCPHCGR